MELKVNWKKQTNKQKVEAKASGEGLEIGREMWLAEADAEYKKKSPKNLGENLTHKRAHVSYFCNPLR